MTEADQNAPSKMALDAATDWYEGQRFKNGNVHTNVMCVGLCVAELLKSYFPLTESIVKTDEGSQVRGLSGAFVSRVLNEHGEMQAFTSEGGRTSRGSLPLALKLADILNGLFPDAEIGRDNANAADQQTNRQGDFQLGTTAFHVTMAPMQKLVARVKENIRDGFRPVVLAPDDKIPYATELFKLEGLGDRVAVQSIETFVGTNIEEMGGFDGSDIKGGIARLIRRYNVRVDACEIDKSLMVVEPEWMAEIVGAWPERALPLTS